MEDKKPELWMFVGPNGSGKSTVTRDMQQSSEFPKIYINADDLKKRKKLSDKMAQMMAHDGFQEHLHNKDSFAFETVGSHESKVEWMQEAKSLGYHIKLFFVCTQDPSINIDRVHNRVAKGGHSVPDDKVISRYERSLPLLQKEFELADEALVFNNSWDKPVVIAQKDNNGKIYVISNQKDNPNSKWTDKAIENLVGFNNPLARTREKLSRKIDNVLRTKLEKVKLPCKIKKIERQIAQLSMFQKRNDKSING